MRTKTLVLRLPSRVLAGTLLAVLFAACTSLSSSADKPPVAEDASGIHASLAFLEDGKPTKADLLARLGPPSGEFDVGRIWTYSGLHVSYHLVVVFGDRDVVKTYRILKVR